MYKFAQASPDFYLLPLLPETCLLSGAGTGWNLGFHRIFPVLSGKNASQNVNLVFDFRLRKKMALRKVLVGFQLIMLPALRVFFWITSGIGNV